MYNWSVLPGGPSIPADREEVRTVTLDSGRLAPQAPAQAGLNRIVFLLSLSVLINYIDRSNLSIAAPLLQAELGISNTQLGTLLSAFFWTYALMQIPAGWLVDRFDVKWVFSAGFLLWSTATGVTGVLHGFTALLLIRVILGIGESIAFPSYSKILGRHFKEEHRGFANAVLLAGLALGPAIGMLVGGRVVGRFGWRPFFIALGLIGLLWLVPWLIWMPRRAAAWKPKASLGFLPILRQRSVWGTCLGQASVNYYLYFLVTWLPTYMIRGRHLSMNGMAKDGGLFLFDVRDWQRRLGQTVRSLDQGRFFADPRPQGIDGLRMRRLWHLCCPARADARPIFCSDADTDRLADGHKRMCDLGDSANSGWA